MTREPAPFRMPNDYLELRFADNTLEMARTDSPDLAEELWLSLHHAAEVESVGIELLQTHDNKRRNHTAEELKNEWRELRAYLRQAETFYRGASPLSWISSPLNYYYSFLNLAKACCLLRNVLPPRVPKSNEAEITPRKIRHGLFENIVIPDGWTATVGSNKDVFALYYELAVGTTIKDGTVLEVHDLLGYSMPIGLQLRKSRYEPRIAAFLSRWALLGNESHSWDLVGLHNRVRDELIPASFFEQYQEVVPATVKGFVLRAFGVQGIETSETRFFQRRNPYPRNPDGSFHTDVMLNDFRVALPHRAYPNLSNAIYQFVFSAWCPTASGEERVPMNPELATYAVWFFLSSLVRYHPEYMDEISTSTDAWLIESFVKSASLDLLRMMTSRLLGYSVVMLRA